MLPWLFAFIVPFLVAMGLRFQIAQKRPNCQVCFYGPDNIVFDAAGNAYITDTDHKNRFRVVKVSADGQFLNEWRLFDGGAGSKRGPEGIAIDPKGNLLVTDAGRRSVLKVSPKGQVLSMIGGADETFEDLGHVATDSAGNIYVSEAGRNLIQKFSSGGKQIAAWKRAKRSGSDQWNHPETIAVRADGTIVVEDWGNRRIVVLSPTGETLFSFGAAGNGPGQFESSSGLAVDSSGNIYVPDDKLHRVQRFDASGQLLAVLPAANGEPLFTDGPGGIAVDRNGDLYSPDGLTIVKYSASGRLLARWR